MKISAGLAVVCLGAVFWCAPRCFADGVAPSPLAPLTVATPTVQPVPSASPSPPDLTSPMAGGSALMVGLAGLPAALIGAVTIVALFLLPAVWPVFR